MATVLTNDENYKNIANAIREKNQTDMTYKPAEMPDAIRAISGEKYVLPVASEETLGGVKGPAKTDGQVQVQVDNEGNMWVPAAGSEGAIPIATEDTIGGVKGPAKTEEETEQVHISEDGQMWVKPSSVEGAVIMPPINKTVASFNLTYENWNQPFKDILVPLRDNTQQGHITIVQKSPTGNLTIQGSYDILLNYVNNAAEFSCLIEKGIFKLRYSEGIRLLTSDEGHYLSWNKDYLGPMDLIVLNSQVGNIIYQSSLYKWTVLKIENAFTTNFITTLVADTEEGQKLMVVDGSKLAETNYAWPEPVPISSGTIGDLAFASTDKLGGIKLPSSEVVNGEENKAKTSVQYSVNQSLAPDGTARNDDTVSVSIPYAATTETSNTPGLIKSARFNYRRIIPIYINENAIDFNAYFPVVFPQEYYKTILHVSDVFEPGVGYVRLDKPELNYLGGVTSEFATLTRSAEELAEKGIPVAIKSNGDMWVPPVGHSIGNINRPGVVVSNGKKTDADTIPVHNDENGRLWVAPSGEGGGGGSYTLPVASQDTLGGVKGAEKVEGDNVPVHINDQGEMFVNALTSPWPEDVLGKIELTYENIFANDLVTPEFVQQLINGKNQGMLWIYNVVGTSKSGQGFQVYKTYQDGSDPSFSWVELQGTSGEFFYIDYYGSGTTFDYDHFQNSSGTTLTPLNILTLQTSSNSISYQSQIWRITNIKNAYTWDFKTTLVSSDGKKTMIVDGSKLASTNYAWPEPISTSIYSYETDIFKDGTLAPTGDATKFGAELSQTARQYLCTHIESLTPEDQVQVYLSQKAAGIAAMFEFSRSPNTSAGSTIAGPCSIQFGSPFNVYTSSFDSTYPGKYNGWYFEESGNLKLFLTPISGFSDNPSMTQLSTLMSLNGNTVTLSMPETTNTQIANGIYFQYHELDMGSGGGGSGGVTMEQVKKYVDQQLGVIENGTY